MFNTNNKTTRGTVNNNTLRKFFNTSLTLELKINVKQPFIFRRFYILGEIRTGSPNDETPWLPNKEMTKPCEVSAHET